MSPETKPQAKKAKKEPLRVLCEKCNGSGKRDIIPRWSPPVESNQPQTAAPVTVDCVACLGTGRAYP